MKRLGVWVILTILVCATAASSPLAAPAAPDRIDRLLGLARVWAEIKFFHPAMFQRAIDWDGALIKAIPRVEAATDAASYCAAIEDLLSVLGEPGTRAELPAAALPATASSSATEWKSWLADGVLGLNARLPGDQSDYIARRRLIRDARPDLAAAKVIVVDLRDAADGNILVNAVLEQLPAIGMWPTIRMIHHDGFRSQGESNRNVYTTAWDITAGGAPTAGATPGPKHVVFIVDPRYTLPLAAVALWTSGHATLVSSQALDDNAAASTKGVALPYGVIARVRVADVLLPGGRGLSTDVVVNRGPDLQARAIAIASLVAGGGTPPRGRERQAVTNNDLRLYDDDDSPATGLPSRERRLLAAIRLWAVIEYFHGPRRFDLDWDKPFRNALPQLDAASTSEAYRDVLGAMLVPLRDGHTGVYAPGERAQRASTAVFWRRVEGKIVAGGIRAEAEAKAAGIAVGDELVSVDGLPIEEVVARNREVIGAGIEEAREQWAIATADRGPRGTTVDDEVRGPGGKAHHVTLRRDFDYDHNFWAHNGPHFKRLPGNLGYVDLTRLIRDEIDPMFAALGDTAAIIFDMRGYPKGTGWLIGERLDNRSMRPLAEIRIPLVGANDVGSDLTLRVLQTGRSSDKPRYRGKIVVLIDDRAISAAEHTCLVLEATGNAKFVGSPTDGANGEETYVRIPGGLLARFTGMEVFHHDGRPLQQVGIQPDVLVRPTLRGLRAGKDEVLERALRYLQTGR